MAGLRSLKAKYLEKVSYWAVKTCPLEVSISSMATFYLDAETNIDLVADIVSAESISSPSKKTVPSIVMLFFS